MPAVKERKSTRNYREPQIDKLQARVRFIDRRCGVLPRAGSMYIVRESKIDYIAEDFNRAEASLNDAIERNGIDGCITLANMNDEFCPSLR